MAYYEAISGVCRSGVTRFGWTIPRIKAYVAGVDKTSSILQEGWTLTAKADGTPAEFRFRVKSFEPVVGADIKVRYGCPNDLLFGGTLLERSLVPKTPESTTTIWDCTAISYEWLLNLGQPIYAEFDDVSVYAVLTTMLGAPGSSSDTFRIGYCPASLGNITMNFAGVWRWDALQRIAAAVGARVRVTPDKIVDMYVTYPETALTTVTQAHILAESLTYREDLSQVRTWVWSIGRGTQTTAAVAAGATLIPVEDVTPFINCNEAIVGRNVIGITNKVAGDTGAGDIEHGNIPNQILYPIPQGETISALARTEDTTADTALGTLLGFGDGPNAVHILQDGRLGVAEMQSRNDVELDALAASLEEVNFTFKTPSRFVKAGRTITLGVTAPAAISGDFSVFVVTLEPYGAIGGTNFEARQHVQLGTFTRALTDLLKQLRG